GFLGDLVPAVLVGAARAREAARLARIARPADRRDQRGRTARRRQGEAVPQDARLHVPGRRRLEPRGASTPRRQRAADDARGWSRRQSAAHELRLPARRDRQAPARRRAVARAGPRQMTARSPRGTIFPLLLLAALGAAPARAQIGVGNIAEIRLGRDPDSRIEVAPSNRFTRYD